MMLARLHKCKVTGTIQADYIKLIIQLEHCYVTEPIYIKLFPLACKLILNSGK